MKNYTRRWCLLHQGISTKPALPRS